MVWNQHNVQAIQKGLLWLRLKQLFERARSIREKHIRESQEAATIGEQLCQTNSARKLVECLLN